MVAASTCADISHRSGAALWMDNCGLKREGRIREVCRKAHCNPQSLHRHLRSFIGFGFAFGQCLQVQFKPDFKTPIDAPIPDVLGPLWAR